MHFRWLPAFLVSATLGISGLTVAMAPTASAATPQPNGSPVGESTWSGPSACGQEATITAPSNAAFMQVVLYGASGGTGGAAASAQGYGGAGGLGSEIQGEFAIQGGQTIAAIVGCQGQSAPQGNGVVGTGGAGGAGWSSGASGGNGYYCAGLCSLSIQGTDGSGGGGGGSTALCLSQCPSSSFSVSTNSFINADPPSDLLAVAGGGGGGGETMCAGTYGGSGGTAGTGNKAADLSGVGEGPGGGSGGTGGTGGDVGGPGGVNNANSVLIKGFPSAGVPGASSGGANFGDGAGSGGGGGGLVGGGGGSGGATDCGAGGGGGAGSSWMNLSAVSGSFGTQSSAGNGGITVTFLEADPPTATIVSPSSGGVYALNQVVDTSFHCAEGQGGSGLQSCTDSNGSTSGSGHLDTSTAGEHTYTVKAVSYDGQVGTASIQYLVAAPPHVQILSPANGSTYVVGQTVATTFECSDSDVAITSCTDQNGASATALTAGGVVGSGHLNTSAPGTFTYTVTGQAAGQTSTASISYTVDQADTTTTVSSSANPSVVGEPVTYTASVAPVSPGAGTPTGTVTFLDNGQLLCSNVPLSTNGATCNATYGAPGSHAISVQYAGDTSFLPSTGSLTQTVDQAATTTSISSSANPSIFGAKVTFTAQVSPEQPGAGTPTGTVTFTDGSTTVATVPLGSNGTAAFTTSDLPAGPQTITATYSGDTNFLGSQASLNQQVSYHLTVVEPGTKSGTINTHRTLPIRIVLTDAQGQVVSHATVALYVDGKPAMTGAGYSAGTDQFTYTGGQYRYLLKVSSADVVNGQITLVLHVSDGTTKTLVFTAK